ncbi:MAG: hypothetical protein EXS10_09490 [Phycisphaerales bacterium]|nr:hypothetical protein [Phycisphaerales bacterium]
MRSTSDTTLAESVTRLSDLYTSQRIGLVHAQAHASHLAAKCEFFLAADAPKVALALDECAARTRAFGRLATLETIRVIDFGAGVGATSVGFLAWLTSMHGRAPQDAPKRVRVEIHAIELGVAAAKVLERSVAAAASHCGFDVTLTVTADDFHSTTALDADLILSQTALNELLDGSEHAAETVALVHRWASAAPMLLIEPALKTTTRALMQLRDALLLRGGMQVVAPCLHQAQCPMLAREGDWCHEARRIKHTPRVEALNRIVGRRDERALFSYLATMPNSCAQEFPLFELAPTAVRLCTDKLGSRGKTERLVCRADGEMRMMRLLDREVRTGNQAFLDTPRGDIVSVEPMPINDRITPEAAVGRLSS